MGKQMQRQLQQQIPFGDNNKKLGTALVGGLIRAELG
jgi:hypothetical protein